MRRRKPAYYDVRDHKRVFEAQSTIFLEAPFQIDPTPLHAQVTGVIVGTPVVQFRDSLYPFYDIVDFGLFFYHLRTTEFDESETVVLHVIGVINGCERLDRSTQAVSGVNGTNDDDHKRARPGAKRTYQPRSERYAQDPGGA
jgi:hypothetical protein